MVWWLAVLTDLSLGAR